MGVMSIFKRRCCHDGTGRQVADQCPTCRAKHLLQQFSDASDRLTNLVDEALVAMDDDPALQSTRDPMQVR